MGPPLRFRERWIDEGPAIEPRTSQAVRARALALFLAAAVSGCIGFNRPTRYVAVVIDGGLVIGGSIGVARTDPPGEDGGQLLAGLPRAIASGTIVVGIMGALGTLLVYAIQHAPKRRFCFEAIRTDGSTIAYCASGLPACYAQRAEVEAAGEFSSTSSCAGPPAGE